MSTVCRLNSDRLLTLTLLMLISILVCACGGGDAKEGHEPPPNDPQTDRWDRFDVIRLNGEGADVPNVRAQVDNQGLVHIFYYKRGDLYEGKVRYQLHHTVWDSQNNALVGEEEMIDVRPPNLNSDDSGLNNSLVLDVGLASDDMIVTAYQGGKLAGTPGGELACNQTSQGDVMVNVLNGANWDEYLGMYGEAGMKNPLFTDGYVGTNGSMAIDGQNNVHLAAQFYYEMCDEHAQKNPDLMYVRRSMSDLGNGYNAVEEFIDSHNVYSGTYAEAVSQMGYRCKLALDAQDNPIIVYVGTPDEDYPGEVRTSLRMARKVGGEWTTEVIQVLEDWQIKSLSIAVGPDNTIGIAYYMESFVDTDDPDHLRYASRQLDGDGEWFIDIADISSHCGSHNSIAFDADGRPVIAYYDIHSNTGSYRAREDLRFARMINANWATETVASAGDIGKYNTVWVDGQNVVNILTYELNNQQIVIFKERQE